MGDDEIDPNSYGALGPKWDWKPGDDPERWPHGYVNSRQHPGICGVEIDPTSDPVMRCLRRKTDPIHSAGPSMPGYDKRGQSE